MGVLSDVLAWLVSILDRIVSPAGLLALVCLLAATWVDVLVHELGHALVYRWLCGGPGAIEVGSAGPSVVLTLGWLTVRLRPGHRHDAASAGIARVCERRMTPPQYLAVALAGPAASCLLGGVGLWLALAHAPGPVDLAGAALVCVAAATTIANLYPLPGHDGALARDAVALIGRGRAVQGTGAGRPRTVAELRHAGPIAHPAAERPSSVAPPAPLVGCTCGTCAPAPRPCLCEHCVPGAVPHLA